MGPAAALLQASRRWCLTGTPIQNSVDDLFSYFRFLRYEPYTRAAAFRKLITEPLTLQPELGYKRLRAVLQVNHAEETSRAPLQENLNLRHASLCLWHAS